MNPVELLSENRDRIVFWAPVLIILGTLLIEVTPLYSIDLVTTGEENEWENGLAEIDFYDEGFTSEFEAEDYFNSENYTTAFDGDVVYETEYDENPPETDHMSEMGEVASAALLWIFVISLVLIAINLELNSRETENWFLKKEVLNAAGLGVIVIQSMRMLASIRTSSIEFTKETYFELGRLEAGFFGGGEMTTMENGIEILQTISWGPGTGFYLSVLVCIFALIGLGAALVSLKVPCPNLGHKNVAICAEKARPVLFGVIILSLLAALVMPWYTVDQDWENYQYGPSEADPSNTEHTFEWNLAPFYLQVVNESGLLEGKEGDVTSDLDAYDAHSEFDDLAPTLIDLRMPLIISLILSGVLIWMIFREKTLNLEMLNSGWSLFILFVLSIVLLSTVSAFTNDLEVKVRKDVSDLSGMEGTDTVAEIGEDQTFGQSYAQAFTELDEDNRIHHLIQTDWDRGMGAHAAAFALQACIALITLVAVSFVIRFIDSEMDVSAFEMNGQTLGVISVVLLLGTLGSGAGNLLVTGDSSAPAPLYTYQLESDFSYESDQEWSSIDAGETWDLAYDTASLPVNNTVRVYLQVTCQEGSQALPADAEDTIDITMTPPIAEVESQSEAGIACDGWSRYYLFEIQYYPDEEVEAGSLAEANSMIDESKFMNGVWSIQVVANVNDGAFPVTPDTDLEVTIEFEFHGYDYYYERV